MREIPQGATTKIKIFMADLLDPNKGKPGLTLTITLSKDCGAFAPSTHTVDDLGGGDYGVALTASHTDTLGEMTIRCTAGGAIPAQRTVLIGATHARLQAVEEALTALTSALGNNTSAIEALDAAVDAMDGTLTDQVAVVAWIKAFTRGKKVRTQTHFRVYHPDIPPTPETPDGTLIFECELKKADGGAPKAMPLTAAVTEEADTVDYA